MIYHKYKCRILVRIRHYICIQSENLQANLKKLILLIEALKN